MLSQACWKSPCSSCSVAEDDALGFVQGFDMRDVMLTSENQANIFSEDGKKMGQSPFLWEFSAKGSSYVFQFIGEWAATWIFGTSCWAWSERRGDGRCCHLVLYRHQVCGFRRHRESKPWGVFSNPSVPWPTTILLSKLSLPPLLARMVDLSTWRNKMRLNWLEKSL